MNIFTDLFFQLLLYYTLLQRKYFGEVICLTLCDR